MHPDCIERLLQHARQDDLEAVYGARPGQARDRAAV